MYDRAATMQRSVSQGYPAYAVAAPQARPYPNAHPTSSAFSASANPNEDWTKITDLAERRRIQNRIAQRNYRKKLKKRLEDLERRAGSSSASPEQTHDELPENEEEDDDDLKVEDTRRRSTGSQRRDRNDQMAVQNPLQVDDRAMFSIQHMRQVSTSPPPFPSSHLSGPDGLNCGAYPNAYYHMNGNTIDVNMYPQYLQTFSHQQQHHMQQSQHHNGYHHAVVAGGMKPQDVYADDDISPFSMGYASMAGVGVDVSAAQSYHDSMAAYTPLSDSFEYSLALSHDGSPPESIGYPRTPPSMPRTPPNHFYEQ